LKPLSALLRLLLTRLEISVNKFEVELGEFCLRGSAASLARKQRSHGE
jgi:hypothetical protein